MVITYTVDTPTCISEGNLLLLRITKGIKIFVKFQLFRHASLIINLFSLMVDSNIPDIALEPDKTVKKVKA